MIFQAFFLNLSLKFIILILTGAMLSEINSLKMLSVFQNVMYSKVFENYVFMCILWSQ